MTLEAAVFIFGIGFAKLIVTSVLSFDPAVVNPPRQAINAPARHLLRAMIWSVMACTKASASRSAAAAGPPDLAELSGTAQVTPGRHSALSQSSHSLRPKRGSGMPRFCLILRRSWSWAEVMVLTGFPNCEATSTD